MPSLKSLITRRKKVCVAEALINLDQSAVLRPVPEFLKFCGRVDFAYSVKPGIMS